MANALLPSFFAKIEQKDTVKSTDDNWPPKHTDDYWVSKLEKSARLKCKNYKETNHKETKEDLEKRKDDQEVKRKQELTDDWQVGSALIELIILQSLIHFGVSNV